MNETTEAPASTKTTIRPDLSKYVRAKSGSGKRTQRTDDFVARTLDGKTLHEVLNGAGQLGIDTGKWSHLNNGQQRMLVGNALRHLLTAKKDPITEAQISAVFGDPTAPYDADAAAAAKAEQVESEGGEEAPKAKGRSRKAK